MKFKYLMYCLIAFSGYAQEKDTWFTTFQIMGKSFQMQMDIEGEKIYLTDVLDHTFKNKLIETELLTTDSIAFSWKQIGLKYRGNIKADQQRIQGQMTQGITWEAEFTKKLQDIKKIKRPQTDHLTLEGERFDILIPGDKIKLGASLYLPKNFSSKTKIAVMISGSGPQDRNEEILGHKPFLLISHYLTSNDIAVLCFDDRGVKNSTGSYATASMEDFTNDVLACVKFLKRFKRTRKNEIGLIGHSEGGMLAMMASKKQKDISFLIFLSSVGTSGKEVLLDQQYEIPLKSGNSEALSKWNQSLFLHTIEIIENHTTEASKDLIYKMIDSMLVFCPDSTLKSSAMSFKTSINNLLNNAWGRSFIQFETKDYLPYFKNPILAINNEKDIQVNAAKNQVGFQNNLSSESKDKSTCIIQPGLNHLFQNCITCDIQEYGELEETFDVNTLKIMVDWIKQLN